MAEPAVTIGHAHDTANPIHKVTTMKFDRPGISDLRIKLSAKLKEIGAELGVSLDLDPSSTYDPEIGFVRFKLTVANATGEVPVSKCSLDFKKYAMIYGLTPEHLGKSFAYAGKQYRLTGLNPKAPRFPVIVEHNGKSYRLPKASLLGVIG